MAYTNREVKMDLDTLKNFGQGVADKIKGYSTNAYAPKNGSAPNLSVGSAKKLESEEPVKESFFSRPTGGRDAEISNGNAQWQGVGGNSVKFNQLVKNGNFANTNNWEVIAESATISVSNGILTLTKNSTILGGICGQEIPINTSHKYYLAATMRISTSTTIASLGFVTTNGTASGNSSVNTSSTSFTRCAIITSPVNDTDYLMCRTGTSTSELGTIGYFKNVIALDLTAMGIDNLTTVAQVEAWLAEHVGLQEYYDYTEGEVVNVNLTGIESVNRNLLDANGDAQIIGEYDDTYGNYYGIKGTHGTITFTDKLGNATTITPDAEGKFYLDVEGTLHVADKDDTTIVFLWYDGSETDYVEHVVNVGRLDLTHIYGKKNGTGDLVRVWPTGAPGLDDLKDLLYLEDGVVKAKRMMGEVDMGNLVYTSNGFGAYYATLNNKKQVDIYTNNLLSSKFVYSYLVISNTGNAKDATICNGDNNNRIFVKYSAITSKEQAPTALSGIKLYHELATPEIYTDLVYMGSEFFEDGTPVALPVNYEADNWGIENILPKNTSTILTAKPEITCLYSMDLAELVDTQRQQIENLDEKKANTNGTYSNMSVGSAENLSGKNPVDIEFTAHKTGDPNIVAKGLAQLNEVRGKSLVWNQVAKELSSTNWERMNNNTTAQYSDGVCTLTYVNEFGSQSGIQCNTNIIGGHKYLIRLNYNLTGDSNSCSLRMIKFGDLVNDSERVFNADTHVSLVKAASSDDSALKIYYGWNDNPTQGTVLKLWNIQLIDLTLMFGAGNEPTSVAEFEKLYPLPYYAYNAGSIVNNNAEGLEVIGFNQWDEEWEEGGIDNNGQNDSTSDKIRSKNYIEVFPNTEYYFNFPTQPSGNYVRLCLYDVNKNYSGRVGYMSPYLYTTGRNIRYVRISMPGSYGAKYNNDICINISNASRNGTYEPYKRVVVDLNIPTLTGKKVVNGSTEGQESVVIYQDTVGEQVVTGMKGAGTAYDVIQQDADKVLRKATKKFGVVDLGSLNWDRKSTYSGNYRFVSSDVVNLKKPSTEIMPTIISSSSKYAIGSPNDSYSYPAHKDNIISVSANTDSGTAVYIVDDSFTSGSDIKTSLSGVLLIYELAEPEEYILDTPIVNNYEEDGDGVERRLPEDTSSVVNAALPLRVTYPIDAVGQLLDMPKDYDTVGSLDNLCSALATTLSSALNGTLAITRGAFDTTTNKYDWSVTFTPNT